MNTIELLRQFRIGPFAIFDFAVSFIAVALLAPLLSRLFRKLGVEIPFVSWMLFTVPVSVLVHIAFGRMTPLALAVVDLRGHWVEKMVIIILLITGICGVKGIRG